MTSPTPTEAQQPPIEEHLEAVAKSHSRMLTYFSAVILAVIALNLVLISTLYQANTAMLGALVLFVVFVTIASLFVFEKVVKSLEACTPSLLNHAQAILVLVLCVIPILCFIPVLVLDHLSSGLLRQHNIADNRVNVFARILIKITLFLVILLLLFILINYMAQGDSHHIVNPENVLTLWPAHQSAA